MKKYFEYFSPIEIFTNFDKTHVRCIYKFKINSSNILILVNIHWIITM